MDLCVVVVYVCVYLSVLYDTVVLIVCSAKPEPKAEQNEDNTDDENLIDFN